MIFFFMFLFFISTVASQTVTQILPISELDSREIQISFNNFCEYPDISIDKQGNNWVAYTEYLNEKENIILKKITDMKLTDSMVINSLSEGFEYYPRLFCDNKNKLWITWCAKRNGIWNIFVRNYFNGKLSDEIQITTGNGIDMHPAISGDKDNNIWIAWESLKENNFDIYAVKISGEKIGEPINISGSAEMDLRPDILCYDNKIFISWDQQNEGNYRALLKQFNGSKWEKEIQLSSPSGFNLASSLSVSKEGVITAAWHSNFQPDEKVGFTPWIFVKELKEKQNNFFTPALEGDWYKTGEDQAFEFPTLIHDKNDLLWIFGRASQNFYVQAVKDDLSSPLYKFEVEGWGGRGQHVRAALSEDGFIYSVRRDINFIYLNRFKPDAAKLTFNNELKHVNFDEVTIQETATTKSKHLGYDLLQLDNNKILFGDIHQHSSLSDGRGTVDECYTRSKFIYKYDFAALTDHEWFTGNLLIPSEWEWKKIIAQHFYEPDKFITFAAYEWTTPRVPKGFGHKNVYFSGWDKPIFSFKFEASSTTDLFNLLKENNAIAFPHHIGWTGMDWENHDVEAQPDVEIVSAHGAFEHMGNEPIKHRGGMPGNFVQDGLSKGLKFGLIGSSDGHGLRWHHGIGRKEDEWQTGLTGAIVSEISKEAIFDALKKRKVYATSGAPLRVIFKVNDKWMGEEINSNTPPEIYIEVIGTSEIDYVILIKDNKEILHLGRDWYDGYGVIKTYVDEDITEGEHFYYLRIVQKDGEMAWSSPVWVRYKKD